MKRKKSRPAGGGNFVTPQEREVQAALTAFWYEHYTKQYTTDQRNVLAEQFAEERLDPTKVKIDKVFIRHPATRLRDFTRSCTVADVLADFIMRVDQVAERAEEFPVSNPDHSHTGVQRRQENELSIHYQYQDDIAEQKGKEPRLPPYSIKESDIVIDNSIETTFFAEEQPDVKQFQAELRRVKRNAGTFAKKYAKVRGYEEAEVIRRIKRLEIRRVRECSVCGNAFYAHDKRRHVCDLQRGIKVIRVKGKKTVYEVTNESACELERNREIARKHAS